MQEFISELPFISKLDRFEKSLFGIEIEAENFTASELDKKLNYWTSTGDSSLKTNGIEFVSRILSKETIPEALNEVYSNLRALRTGQVTFGPRTSIHIHSDVTWMTNINQAVPLIFMYLLCEDLMYKFVEPHRRKNIFCVKTKETKYLRKAFIEQQFSANNMFKYAGFNLQSFFAHGTVEFRMLEGTYNHEKILNWIEFIHAIQTYAKQSELGLSFKREVKNPERAIEAIYPLFKPFFNEEEIEQSIQAGLEYFRYLVCSPLQSRVRSIILEEDFFHSKFYTKNYVRLSK